MRPPCDRNPEKSAPMIAQRSRNMEAGEAAGPSRNRQQFSIERDFGEAQQFTFWTQSAGSGKDEGRDPPVSRAKSRPFESGRQDLNLRPLGPEARHGRPHWCATGRMGCYSRVTTGVAVEPLPRMARTERTESLMVSGAIQAPPSDIEPPRNATTTPALLARLGTRRRSSCGRAPVFRGSRTAACVRPTRAVGPLARTARRSPSA